MGKINKSRQINLSTPEGVVLISNFRSNLNVKMEVDENNEVGLKLSIDPKYASTAFADFLRQSILNRTEIPDNQLLNDIAETASLGNNSPDWKGLTPKEIKILEELSEGKTVKEAANKLGMCYNTGRTHLKSIYKKLNVKKVSMAVLEYQKLKKLNSPYDFHTTM